jgi:hypothetical protein
MVLHPGLDLVVTAGAECATVDFTTLSGWLTEAVSSLNTRIAGAAV